MLLQGNKSSLVFVLSRSITSVIPQIRFMRSIKTYSRYALLSTYELLLEYDTPKYVHVQDKFAGLFFRLIQFCVLLFISLYLVWWKAGYQKVGYVSSVTTYKLKGVSLGESHDENPPVSQFWDPVDYTIPVKQKDQFIIPTRYIYTPRQAYGYCPESPKYSKCNSDNDCSANIQVSYTSALFCYAAAKLLYTYEAICKSHSRLLLEYIERFCDSHWSVNVI